MMPLSLANIDEEYIIKKVGGSEEIKSHLQDLGFVVGSNIKVINKLGKNIIVNVKETRIAINDQMAQKILI